MKYISGLLLVSHFFYARLRVFLQFQAFSQLRSKREHTAWKAPNRSSSYRLNQLA